MMLYFAVALHIFAGSNYTEWVISEPFATPQECVAFLKEVVAVKAPPKDFALGCVAMKVRES